MAFLSRVRWRSTVRQTGSLTDSGWNRSFPGVLSNHIVQVVWDAVHGSVPCSAGIDKAHVNFPDFVDGPTMPQTRRLDPAIRTDRTDASEMGMTPLRIS
jgi:hypothetical protein